MVYVWRNCGCHNGKGLKESPVKPQRPLNFCQSRKIPTHGKGSLDLGSDWDVVSSEAPGSLRLPPSFWPSFLPPTPSLPAPRVQKGTYQDVQASGLEQGDLVCDGQASEARQTLGELHDLNNALGGQLAEFVPEAQVQPDPVVSTGILRGREKKGRRRVNDNMPLGGLNGTLPVNRLMLACSELPLIATSKLHKLLQQP